MITSCLIVIHEIMNIIVKLLLLVISMFIIARILVHSYSKKQNEVIRNIDNCIVSNPKILKGIFIVISVLGTLLLFICLFLKKKGVNIISMGHVYLSIVVMLIGIIGSICIFRWKIVVQGESIVFYHIFSCKTEVNMKEIDKVSIEENGRMLISVKGKVVKKIDPLVENYWEFYHVLKQQGVYFDE